jgi:hypothetical protein
MEGDKVTFVQTVDPDANSGYSAQQVFTVTAR